MKIPTRLTKAPRQLTKGRPHLMKVPRQQMKGRPRQTKVPQPAAVMHLLMPMPANMQHGAQAPCTTAAIPSVLTTWSGKRSTGLRATNLWLSGSEACELVSNVKFNWRAEVVYNGGETTLPTRVLYTVRNGGRRATNLATAMYGSKKAQQQTANNLLEP